MSDEIVVSYITGKTVTADVYQPDGSERDFGAGDAGISLTEAAHAGLYLGDCATIAAGDIIVAYDGSDYIGGEEYLPELYNLDTRLDSIDTDLDDILAAQQGVKYVYDDTNGDEGTAKGVYPEKC